MSTINKYLSPLRIKSDNPPITCHCHPPKGMFLPLPSFPPSFPQGVLSHPAHSLLISCLSTTLCPLLLTQWALWCHRAATGMCVNVWLSVCKVKQNQSIQPTDGLPSKYRSGGIINIYYTQIKRWLFCMPKSKLFDLKTSVCHTDSSFIITNTHLSLFWHPSSCKCEYSLEQQMCINTQLKTVPKKGTTSSCFRNSEYVYT